MCPCVCVQKWSILCNFKIITQFNLTAGYYDTKTDMLLDCTQSQYVGQTILLTLPEEHVEVIMVNYQTNNLCIPYFVTMSDSLNSQTNSTNVLNGIF